jgi:hypothetical protein
VPELMSACGVEAWAGGELGDLADFEGERPRAGASEGSRTTLVGVALTLNADRGELATFVGDRLAALLTGDDNGGASLAGVVDRASFLGERERRLLARRVDRFFRCVSSTFSATSTGSEAAGIAGAGEDPTAGCIGHREL